jgi:hypothetical protein
MSSSAAGEEKEGVPSEFQLILSKLNSISDKVDGVANDLTAFKGEINDKVDLLAKEFSNFKGELNERTMRDLIARSHGDDFASSFVLQGLSGLARFLCSPKRSDPGFHARSMEDIGDLQEEHSDLQRQNIWIKKLVTFIYSARESVARNLHAHGIPEDVVKNIFTSKNKISEEDKNSLRTLRDAPDAKTKALAKYLLLDKVNRDYMIRNDCGVGMLLFTAAAGVDFVHEVELDCRGDVSMIPSFGERPGLCTITVGEIKSSSSGKAKAVEQLDRTLSIIEAAIIATSGRNAPNVYKRGLIFLPKSERARHTEALPTSRSHIDVCYI